MRSLLFMGLLGSGLGCGAQPSTDSTRISGLMSILSDRHFAPRTLDDRFSSDVYDSYLRTIDPDTLFLSMDEREWLATDRTRIDEQLKHGMPSFLLRCDSLMRLGLQRAVRIVNGEGDDTPLATRWHQRLRVQALGMDLDPSDARQLVVRRTKAELERLIKLGATERVDLFLATLAGVHDAQSTYLSPEERSGFDLAMTGTFVGVGIHIVRNGMRLRVEDLEPGGPAALTGAIAPGDELVQVSGPDGAMIPVIGMAVEEVVRLLRGPAGSTAALHVRKASGNMTAVEVQRAVIHPDAGRAQALCFVGPGSSIGCITLPRFYTDLSGGDGPRCSSDVPILLDLLMEAGIDGLVIDLRNNQGGSMNETIRLLGLFLDAGPVAQRLARDGTVRVLSTEAPKARYRGPLVVLVNERSASASEFFAAALQDHRRAVIMGTPRTYGKGTIQTLADLPLIAGADGASIPTGTAKLTVGLFFRPSGRSVQLDGVVPDITLQGYGTTEPTGERALPFALAHPGIAATPYTAFTTDELLPATVRDRAVARARVPLSEAGPFEHRAVEMRAPWTHQDASSRALVLSDDPFRTHGLLLLHDLVATTRP